MVQKSGHHLGCIIPCKEWWYITHQPQLVIRISEPSTVFAESTRDFLKFTMNPRDPRSYLWRKPPCKNGNLESRAGPSRRKKTTNLVYTAHESRLCFLAFRSLLSFVCFLLETTEKHGIEKVPDKSHWKRHHEHDKKSVGSNS